MCRGRFEARGRGEKNGEGLVVVGVGDYWWWGSSSDGWMDALTDSFFFFFFLARVGWVCC